MSETYGLTNLTGSEISDSLLCGCQANIECRVVYTRTVSMYSRCQKMSTGTESIY